MAAPYVKAEPFDTSSSTIKAEPSTPSIKPDPGYADDDDVYEDAGDLDISQAGRAVWLVKLPQFLADRWKDIDEDEEITLGTVKVDRNAPDQKNVCVSASRW